MSQDQPKNNKLFQDFNGAMKKVSEKVKVVGESAKDKTKLAAATVIQKTKEVDEKLHISEKTKSIASNVKAKAKGAASKMKKSVDDDDLSYSEQSIGTVSHQNK